jgi:chloride channel protein, CIC family
MVTRLYYLLAPKGGLYRMIASEVSTTSRLRDRLRSWVDPRLLRQHEQKLFLVLTLLIGAIVGLVVAAFILVTENLGARLYPSDGAPWRRLVTPVLGALITGILLKKYFPSARGSGIPQTKVALFLNDGVIFFRTLIGRFGLSSVSLASGLALGREGPSVQLGAGVASVLGRKLGLSPTRVKTLLPVGVSAALAAAFNTPIAAVLFTMEEIMGDMNAPVLGSIVLSSATSWIVMHLVLGDEPLFHVPSYQLVHPVEFLIYGLLGIAGGLVSVAFVRLLLWQRERFMSLPDWTQSYAPVVGGLTVGVMGWFIPEVLGVGYAHVGEALNGQMALRLMFLLVGMKLVATATCYSSGCTGGIFGPSLFIGAMLGGAVGGGVHSLFPEYTGSAGAYALVGMGTTFAGIVRVPMTSVIMIFEITRDYSIIVPVMISNLVAYAISSKLQPVPIYEALQHQEGLHLPTGHSKERALLVEDALRADRLPFPDSMTVVEALAKLESKADSWPVIRLDGANDDELQGLVTVRQLRESVESGHSDRKLGEVIHGTDDKDPIHLRHFPHVHMDHSLDTAQRRMANGRTNVLPVINRTNIRRITGVLLMEDIQRAYGIELSEPKPEPEQGRMPAGMTLLRMVAVTLGVLILIGMVTRVYQNERTSRAATAYQAGIALVAQGSIDEAIERFRTALSTTPNNKEYRLALGSALVQGEHFDEASLYLSGVLKSDPDNGPANLEMARAEAKNATLAQTAASYRKAVFGVWTKGREPDREQVVVELADYLFAHGAQAEAALELVGLARQSQTSLAMKERAATKLLSFHEPAQALAVFQEIVASNPHDGNAWAGLGEAQFALGDYPSAEVSLQNGATWASSDQNLATHLKTTQEILSMDPSVRGASVSERYHRSVNLLRHMLDLVEMCKPPLASAPDLSRLVARASQQLKQERPENTETAAANVSMAEELWGANQKWCGASSDPALALLMPLLSK